MTYTYGRVERLKMKKVVVLPRVNGNGHGGSFVGRKGHLEPKPVVEVNKICSRKIGPEVHC
tara:strand:- start:398 stop:580 length:183 start_codon:yes stop_codon:yes gene_type:complete